MASAFNAQSDPGVVFKSFSASQQSIRTMGECRDVTDQYQTGRSAYLRLGQLFMRLFAGLL